MHSHYPVLKICLTSSGSHDMLQPSIWHLAFGRSGCTFIRKRRQLLPCPMGYSSSVLCHLPKTYAMGAEVTEPCSQLSVCVGIHGQYTCLFSDTYRASGAPADCDLKESASWPQNQALNVPFCTQRVTVSRPPDNSGWPQD